MNYSDLPDLGCHRDREKYIEEWMDEEVGWACLIYFVAGREMERCNGDIFITFLIMYRWI